MKTMMTMPELAAEIERVQGAKADYLADTRRLGFYASSREADDGGIRALTIDGAPDSPLFNLTRYAEGQIASRLQIPRKFWDRLSVDHPDILQGTVTKLFVREPEERMVRTLDGKARAFLSNRYRRIDNAEIAEHAILPALAEIPNVEFASLGLTETRMHIKAVLPRLQAEVKVGDVVQAGIAISNSEVGAGAFTVSLMLYRLICKNGMIAGDSLRKYHTGGRLTVGGDDEGQEGSIFSDETLLAADRALFLEARDLVKAAANEVVFNDLVDRLRDLAGLKVEAAPPAAVEQLGNRYDLSEGEQGSILAHLTEGGDLSAWGYVNAVTRASQDVDDYERATELEKLGGRLVELPAQDWRLN